MFLRSTYANLIAKLIIITLKFLTAKNWALSIGDTQTLAVRVLQWLFRVAYQFNGLEGSGKDKSTRL